MTGVVHHRENHARDLQVLQQGAAVAAAPTPLGGVRPGVEQHPCCLGVSGDRPEPFAIGCVLGRSVPPHRRLEAVDLEQVVGEAVGEVVEVGEIDVG